jgi:predicted helicase
MHHLLSGANIGLVVVKRQPQDTPVSYVFLSEDIISNGYIRSDSVSIDSIFPLYKYPENSDQQTLGENVIRTPNLNMSIVNQIANELQLIFTPEKEDRQDTFSPIDLLDYIYAVLHCPSYREKYQDFLKTDFPRVPYPTNTDIFWQLVQLGSELRQLHLLKSIIVMKPITQYPVNGDNVVTKLVFEAGRVFINNNQYFANVPEIAWHFYIGGYQPAQKWLKDRKEEKLSFDDIRHYQKIIVALTETHRIMGEIDQILIEA